MSLLQEYKGFYERVGPNTVMFYQQEGRENSQWKAASLSCSHALREESIPENTFTCQSAEMTLIIPIVHSIGIKVLMENQVIVTPQERGRLLYIKKKYI